MSKRISLFVGHSYIKNSPEFSICLSEKIEDWYLIHSTETFYDESFLEEYINKYQESIGSYIEKKKLFINNSRKSFDVLKKLESMRLLPQFSPVYDWDYIRSLSYYINSGKLKFDSPDIAARVKQAIPRDFRASRMVRSLTGCVGLALDRNFERIGNTGDVVRLAD